METLTYIDAIDTYKSENYVAQREDGTTPNGNQMAGRWVLRNAQGEYLDHDRYRHDMFSRHNLKVKYWNE